MRCDPARPRQRMHTPLAPILHSTAAAAAQEEAEHSKACGRLRTLTMWMGPLVRNSNATFGMPRASAHMSCQCRFLFRWYRGWLPGVHLSRNLMEWR